MNAITWTKIHLPHRLPSPAPAARPDDRRHVSRRWQILAASLAAYGLLLVGLVVAARTAFGMSADPAWGFAIGVASYIFLFTGFIAGLAWCVVNNRMDDPRRF